MLSLKRLAIALIAFMTVLALISQSRWRSPPSDFSANKTAPSDGGSKPSSFDIAESRWAQRKEHYPVSEYASIPRPGSKRLRRVQHQFSSRELTVDATRCKERQSKVKAAMQRCWKSYHERAWMRDELAPISGGYHDSFGGWAATLVDSLDTLWIMGLQDEFREAVDAAVDIDFDQTSQDVINVFETTIRYLGGFLAAFDLSGDPRLLEKSLELAHMLYAAFDTPNRMPITRWNFNAALRGEAQIAPDGVLLAEIGSLTLEFTRLAQVTDDPKWYDAVHRIMAVFDSQQNASNLPGMWPMVVNARDEDFKSGNHFTLGAMADSMYEYLPKMYALLGGSDFYARLFGASMDSAIRYNLYRPMTQENADILMSGPAIAENGQVTTRPEGQHLVCFVGGMLALGGRLIGNETYVELGRKVTDGCVWAYESSPLGIMPETYSVVMCKDKHECPWEATKWHAEILQHAGPEFTGSGDDMAAVIKRERLPPGFTSIGDRRYILRPEAIESVFYLYRITGDPKLRETAWKMFENISKHTETQFGNAAINDMTNPSAPKSDSMESFWTAETLKYFYLTFSDPSLISLDEYVFNTEAHPFKRPTP